jgi:hypothetical protein
MSEELSLLKNPEYRNFLSDLKERIRSVQMRSALALNTELIGSY